MDFGVFLVSPYIWLAVAAIAAIIEALSFGLVTMWFVVGALVSFLIAFFGGPAWLQLIAFLVVSIACLVLLRPVILKYRKHGKEHEATQIGQNAVVVEEINGAALKGRVETSDHMTWAAISSDESVIEAGARVRVVGQESIKLVVERI